ncbi:WD40-repeat-containing domain protein, partial [Pavlovales sp. CCMP2436]
MDRPRANLVSLLREREQAPGRRACARIYEWAVVECYEHGELRSTYCRLPETARSSIALSWSPDMTLLASTHGDHSVRVFNLAHGDCVAELVGHQRTPWTVKFHPCSNDVVVSGALDGEVRLWDVLRARCIASRRLSANAVASISFSSSGLLLAMSTANTVFLW